MESKILSTADKVVSGTRQGDYGHPYYNFRKISRLWSEYLDLDINPTDVALMMVMLKIARLQNTPTHEDSLIDIAGYVKCYELIQNYEEPPTEDRATPGSSVHLSSE